MPPAIDATSGAPEQRSYFRNATKGIYGHGIVFWCPGALPSGETASELRPARPHGPKRPVQSLDQISVRQIRPQPMIFLRSPGPRQRHIGGGRIGGSDLELSQERSELYHHDILYYVSMLACSVDAH
jgi:hypothetical protein